MTPLPYAGPAIATAEAAATLPRTGRTTMALTLLGGLPDLIRSALEAARPTPPSPTALWLETAELARLRGQARELVAETARLCGEHRQAEADLASRRRELGKLDAELAKRRRALERPGRPAEQSTEPRRPKPHELLSAALASGAVTAERMAGLLRVNVGDVAPITAGRVGLGETTWRRLLAELGTGT